MQATSSSDQLFLQFLKNYIYAFRSILSDDKKNYIFDVYI